MVSIYFHASFIFGDKFLYGIVMAEDLLNLWKIFSLSKEENLAVEASDQGLNNISDRGKSCLVGKLLADQIIGKDALKSTLIKGWKPSGTMVFKNLGDNLFLVEFEHLWVKARSQSSRKPNLGF